MITNKQTTNVYALVGMYEPKTNQKELFEHCIETAIKIYKNVLIEKYNKSYVLTKELIISKNRDMGIVYIRQLISYYLRSRKFKFNKIGEFMGGQDHTTAINAVNSFQDRLDTFAPIPRTLNTNRGDIVEDYNYFKRML